jgi:hypothetical protein
MELYAVESAIHKVFTRSYGSESTVPKVFMVLYSSEGTNYKVDHRIVRSGKGHPQSFRGMYGSERNIPNGKQLVQSE